LRGQPRQPPWAFSGANRGGAPQKAV